MSKLNKNPNFFIVGLQNVELQHYFPTIGTSKCIYEQGEGT